MLFFIDTNIFVASLRGLAPQVRTRLQELGPAKVRVPCQVLAELRVGAAKSAQRERNEQQVSAILQPFVIAWPDAAIMERYVDVRVSLERAGTPISEADLWIVATTLAADGKLVTSRRRTEQREPPRNSW